MVLMSMKDTSWSVTHNTQYNNTSTSTVADGAMDLMSFMEFQQSFRAAQQSHQASIQVTHHFWQLLMRKDKNFRSISGGLRKIQIVELATQKLYR